MNKGAVVLFSGGIDSTTALHWARRRFDPVRALIVDYGQQHRIEVDMAKKIASGLAIVHDVLLLPLQTLLRSALLADGRVIPESLAAARLEPGAPSTYVPFRNGIFLALAAAYGESHSCLNLVTGFNAVDSPDYPDTTVAFSKKMAAAIDQGTPPGPGGEKFKVHTPLISLSKEEIITMGFELGADYAYSISCYRGAETPCGHCSSCDIRARAFAGLKRQDPLLARLHKEGNA